MSAENPAVDARKLQKRLQRRRAIRESWPLLVWFAVLALAVWAYNFGGEFHRMRGVVSQQINYVSSPVTGNLVQIPDELAPRDEQGNIKKLSQGDWVTKDQVVAKLDDRVIEAEIGKEIEEAELMLTQEMQKTFVILENLHREISQLKTQQQILSDGIEAEKLRLERIRELRKDGLATDVDLAEVETAIISLESQRRGVETQIAEAEERVEKGEDVIDRLRAQVNKLANPETSDSLQFLKAQKEQTIIRASRGGRIQKIWKTPGDVVRAGDPIMEILVEEDKTITALIPEEFAMSLQLQQEVWVAPADGQRNFRSARVISMAPGLTQLQDLASPIQGRMMRGRLVELGNLEGADTWIPGSSVIISLDKPGALSFLARFIE